MKYSTTHGGILVVVLGYALVNVFGLSDACSSEITAKAVEWIPIVVGSITAWIGRIRATEPTTVGGFRSRI